MSRRRSSSYLTASQNIGTRFYLLCFRHKSDLNQRFFTWKIQGIQSQPNQNHPDKAKLKAQRRKRRVFLPKGELGNPSIREPSRHVSLHNVSVFESLLSWNVQLSELELSAGWLAMDG